MSEQPDIHINDFNPELHDLEKVADMILDIQTGEFGVEITLDDQPDLKDIPTFYQQGEGMFLTASIRERIVGTIGMLDVGDDIGVIRKMFVMKEFRGKRYGIAASLLGELEERAKAAGIQELYLGTIHILEAAIRFYEKNGYEPIEKNDLPAHFPLMAVDDRFFSKHLG